MNDERPLTREEILALPALMGLRDAARALNIPYQTAARLKREGKFPVPEQRVGQRSHFLLADILAYLKIEER